LQIEKCKMQIADGRKSQEVLGRFGDYASASCGKAAQVREPGLPILFLLVLKARCPRAAKARYQTPWVVPDLFLL
jgi:hypothetical protein